MKDVGWYHRIIAGRGGPIGVPARAALRVGSLFYDLGVSIRNGRFDSGSAVHTPSIPVISVGNITVGGTGKTPLVVDVVRRLQEKGWNPAVVARGYGSSPGQPNDEELLIREHCPSVAYVAGADRVIGVERARAEFKADVAVLDDGFQHRRIARVLDIVLIDATCPFGFGHLLPRGLLREPVTELFRADVTVITRSDQVSRQELDRIRTQVAQLAPQATHLVSRHKVTGCETIGGDRLDCNTSKQRTVLFAAIGNPKSFALSATSAGVTVVGQRWWSDHHRYTERNMDDLANLLREKGADILLTTQKDAVKLRRLGGSCVDQIGVLTVAIDFVGGDDTIFNQLLEKCLHRV